MNQEQQLQIPFQTTYFQYQVQKMSGLLFGNQPQLIAENLFKNNMDIMDEQVVQIQKIRIQIWLSLVVKRTQMFAMELYSDYFLSLNPEQLVLCGRDCLILIIENVTLFTQRINRKFSILDMVIVYALSIMKPFFINQEPRDNLQIYQSSNDLDDYSKSQEIQIKGGDQDCCLYFPILYKSIKSHIILKWKFYQYYQNYQRQSKKLTIFLIIIIYEFFMVNRGGIFDYQKLYKTEEKEINQSFQNSGDELLQRFLKFVTFNKDEQDYIVKDIQELNMENQNYINQIENKVKYMKNFYLKQFDLILMKISKLAESYQKIRQIQFNQNEIVDIYNLEQSWNISKDYYDKEFKDMLYNARYIENQFHIIKETSFPNDCIEIIKKTIYNISQFQFKIFDEENQILMKVFRNLQQRQSAKTCQVFIDQIKNIKYVIKNLTLQIQKQKQIYVQNRQQIQKIKRQSEKIDKIIIIQYKRKQFQFLA